MVGILSGNKKCSIVNLNEAAAGERVKECEEQRAEPFSKKGLCLMTREGVSLLGVFSLKANLQSMRKSLQPSPPNGVALLVNQMSSLGMDRSWAGSHSHIHHVMPKK